MFEAEPLVACVSSIRTLCFLSSYPKPLVVSLALGYYAQPTEINYLGEVV